MLRLLLLASILFIDLSCSSKLQVEPKNSTQTVTVEQPKPFEVNYGVNFEGMYEFMYWMCASQLYHKGKDDVISAEENDNIEACAYDKIDDLIDTGAITPVDTSK